MLGEKPVFEVGSASASACASASDSARGSSSDCSDASSSSPASRESETAVAEPLPEYIMNPKVTDNVSDSDSCRADTDENTTTEIQNENVKSHSKGTSKEANMKVDITDKVHVEDFQILKLLGKGAYGKVYQVRKIYGPNKGHIFAMKAIHKASISESQTDQRHTKSERDVLVQVSHPFIVKLHYAFETRKRLFLVQEFCNGGELFRRMEVERLMSEDDARFYLSEIVCALEYLHEHDIIYRDLKTENVMLDSEGHVRLIDFGLSKLNMEPGVLTNTFCGTVEYMAPEVVSRGAGYSKPSDWWSFGVFTYDLLTGRSPFYSNRGKAETKQRIMHGKLTLPVYVTRNAQDLIKKLLRRPVSRRLGTNEGAIEIKSHCFFAGVNWDDVYNKVLSPPFIPEVKNSEDVSNFDSRFTGTPVSRESADESIISKKGACKSMDDDEEKETSVLKDHNAGDQFDSMFSDFDYVSPEMYATELEGHLSTSMQEMKIRTHGSP